MRAAHDTRARQVRDQIPALAGVAVAVLQVSPLFAQDEGPIVIGQREQLRGIQFESLDIALELLGTWQFDETDTAEGESTRDTDVLFREILELRTKGFIGHPNLLNFDLMGRFGMEQQEISSDTLGADERTDGTVFEYDATFNFLRETALPATLYARQSQNLINRQFGASIDSESSQFGGMVFFRSDVATTQLHLFHREESQSSALDDLDFDMSQDTLDAQGQINIGLGHLITWDYTFDMIEESGQLRRTNSFDRHDVYVNDSVDFGGDDEHNLRSTVHYLTESGDFPFDRFRWDESLVFRHSRTLETRYDYTFDRQGIQGQDQTLHLGTARLRHKLFESLVTTAEAGGSSLAVSPGDFTSDQVFGSVGTEYTKRVPFGELLATANVAFSHQNDSDRGAELRIVDEPHIFGSSGIVVLDRRNIIATSIEVTSASGFIIYREGADYSLRVDEDRVEIRRVLGGDISDGETVLIDYSLGPEPGSTTDTAGIGGTARYRFEEGPLTGVSVYSRFFHQTQNRSSKSGLVDLPESDLTDLIFGADYDRAPFFLRAEYEIRTGSVSPFNALRLEGTFTQPVGAGSTLALSAVHHQIDRTDDDSQSAVLTLSGSWSQQWTEHLRSRLLLIWRDEAESDDVDTQGFEQQMELRWNYRQTSAYIGIRNAFLESGDRDSSFQTFTLGLRREF